MSKFEGVWVPRSIAECLPRLSLRPQSRWRVFLAVLMTWCRYGRTEARLSVVELCAMTGLAERTVKGALSNLISMGLVRRVGRYKRLVVVTTALSELTCQHPTSIPIVEKEGQDRFAGADKLAPPKGTHACTSSISTYVFKKKGGGESGFTRKQLITIHGVMDEARTLLGSDPYALTITPRFIELLGLPVGTTYGTAMRIIDNNDKVLGRTFVGAILALRSDPRVVGTELIIEPKSTKGTCRAQYTDRDESS